MTRRFNAYKVSYDKVWWAEFREQEVDYIMNLTAKKNSDYTGGRLTTIRSLTSIPALSSGLTHSQASASYAGQIPES